MKGLLLVYLLTALGTVGSLRNPRIGLYTYVGFAVLRPQAIWSFAGDISNVSFIVGCAMLAGWALHGFGKWQFGRARSILAALLAFQLWVFLSALQAIEPTSALDWTLALLKVVAPVMVGVTVIEDSKQLRTLMWIIVVAQAYVSYELNASYYFNGYNQANDVGFGGMDNNSLGLCLACTVGPAVALVISEKKWRWRALASVCGVLILHATLLTFSRGAIVGLIAVGAIAFVAMPKRPSYLAVLMLAVLLGVRLTGPQLLAKFNTAFAESGDRDWSAQSRIDLWLDCWKVAVTHPVFGVGPRNWAVVAADYGWTEGKEAHSTWMQTLAETGFPGLFMLMTFFGLAWMKIVPYARSRINEENRFEVGVAMAVVMTIAAFGVAGQFVTLTGLEVPYYITMLGIVLIKHRSRVPQPEIRGVRMAPPRLVPPNAPPIPSLAYRGNGPLQRM